MTPTVRILVADDDPFSRRTVRGALEAAGAEVVAEAGTGREAVELAVHYAPDIVLMDLIMPEMTGLEATAQLAERAPEIKVILLTASADDELGLAGLRAGAVGFLSKAVDLDALPRAVFGAGRGEAVISRGFGMAVVRALRETRTPDGMRPVRSVLSDREWEVLDLLCEDPSTDHVARALVLSPQTVRTHVKSILRKLEVSSRQEAVAMAAQLRSGG